VAAANFGSVGEGTGLVVTKVFVLGEDERRNIRARATQATSVGSKELGPEPEISTSVGY
jgi:hypothetical protein